MTAPARSASMTKRTKYRMWAVFTPRGYLCVDTVRQKRGAAINLFSDRPDRAAIPAFCAGGRWPHFRHRGYRVARVVVSEQ